MGRLPLLSLVVLLAASLLAPGAFCECPSFGEMDHRIKMLGDRIEKHAASGELSDAKAAHLRKMLSRVTEREARCRAGHNMSQWEANRLNDELTAVSSHLNHALNARRSHAGTKAEAGGTGSAGQPAAQSPVPAGQPAP